MSNLYEVYPNYSNNNLNNLWKPIDNNWNNTYSLKNISKDTTLSSSPYALYTPLQNLQQQSNLQTPNLQQNYLQQQSNLQHSNLQPKNLQQQSYSQQQSNLPTENFVNYEKFIDFTSRDLNSKFIRPNITENQISRPNTNNLIENYNSDCEKFLNHYKNCNYCQYIHYKKCKYKHSFLFDFLIYILIGIFLIKLLKYN